VTLSALNNLAIILKKNSEFEAAKTINLAVYSLYSSTLGNSHTHTLIALQNLIDTYKLNNELETALKLLDDLLISDNKNLKQLDVITLNVQKSTVIREMGKYQMSEQLING